MTEIEEWVYRGAGIKDPLPCGETCMALWNAEQKESKAAQEFWDQLGALYTEKTKLWGSLSELRNSLNEGGLFTLGTNPIRVGWHIGSGEGSKWMELVGPKAPGQSIGCTPGAAFKLTDDEIGSSYYEHPRAPGNEWYMIGCGNSEIVGKDARAENPSQPGNNCGKSGLGVELLGWTAQIWQWNLCGEGFYEGKEVWAPVYAEGFYQRWRIYPDGRIEPQE